MRRLVLSAVLSSAILGCGSWSRVGGGKEPTAGESLTRVLNSTQFYQTPRPARRRRAAAVRRHRGVRRRAGGQRHRRPRPLAREPGARVPARGQRLRRALPGEPLVQARGRALGRRGARGDRPRADLPGDPPERREHPVPAGPPAAPGQIRRERDRARCGLDLREPRPGRLHGAELRAGRRERADPRVPGDGAGEPGRSAQPGAQPARRRWATAATRCSPTSRATGSPSRPPSPSRWWTSSSTSSTRTSSASAAGTRSRARSSGSRPTACRWASSSWWWAKGRRSARSRPWSRSPRPGSSPTSTRCSICSATSGTTTR